jgi:hypothetical protein
VEFSNLKIISKFKNHFKQLYCSRQKVSSKMEMAGRFFLKWRFANLLVGFPDIEFGFGTRVRSLPDALRIATPKKRLPGAGGGFLTSWT